MISRSVCLSLFAIVSLIVFCMPMVDAELKLLSVLFRHGERTPDDNGYEMYPTDPYLNFNFYPTGLGQLTNRGKQQEFKIGKVLRENYDTFLGSIYTPGDVEALSSDYDRTKMSLQLVLAALYPPPRIQLWNPQLNWQPIPANYLRKTEDNLFLPDECPRFIVEYNRIIDSPEGQKKLSKFADLSEKLTNLTGKNITRPLDYYYLYHTLMSEYSMGLPLPEWAYTIFPLGQLFDATILAYEFGSYNTFLKRIYGGPYIRIVRENILALRNGTLKNPAKIYLYSGHETNIASVLKALGIFYPHVPEYSSAIILELHHTDTYYVKLQYYLGIPSVVIPLQMPECDILCPLDSFLKLTKDIIPTDEELICDKTLTRDYASYKPTVQIESMTYNLIRIARTTRNG